MEKRALVAIALSILVLIGFRYLEERRLGGPARQTLPAQKAQPTGPAEPKALPRPEETKPSSPPPAETQAVGKSIVVEGDLYQALLDNRGALLTSFKLKQYKSGKGEPFEMIAATHGAETRPYPGALVLEDPDLNWNVNGEPYGIVVEGGKDPSQKLTPPLSVTLRLRRGDLFVEKRYRFHRENYLVDYSVVLQRGGTPVAARILLGQDIGPEHEHLLNPSVQLQAVSRRGGKVQRDGPPKEENQVQKLEGEAQWVGLEMLYFSVIAMPPRPFAAFELQKMPVKTVGLDGTEITRDLLRLTVPIQGPSQFTLFMGPKESDSLSRIQGADLSGVIDYGMFSFLVVPLLYSLKWIHTYVHNYGVAIILLTFIITLLLFPFRIKQMVSMKKMQVIQPKVKEIQEKYKRYKKTDPKRAEMNKEVMALYKAHNVNPLGGCLPLLLQMPILFAFYQLLAASIELRQAPFLGWVQDLSVKDPFYVLPIIMGVTMLISQKMTPMSPGTDPVQAKMMMMMPVIFTVMFLNVSSGLNLYFLCSNIFQIAMQKVTERWMSDRKPARTAKA